MTAKLSPTQERAMAKLTQEWQSAYELRESLATLGSLVRKGLAEVKHGYGSMFLPRAEIKYRRKETNHATHDEMWPRR
jgi:hypothetical protein